MPCCLRWWTHKGRRTAAFVSISSLLDRPAASNLRIFGDMDNTNENEEDGKSLFSLNVSIDRDKHFRRTCPECGRDFKTEINEADIAWAVAPQIRRMGLEIGGLSEHDTEEPKESLIWCPYCRCKSEISKTLTEEMTNYLTRLMMREFVLPMTNKLFSGLEDIGKSSGGLISIRVEHSRATYPPRPIHGPESSDMKIIEFLCCRKKAKISDRWYGLDLCVYCGCPVAIV